MQRILDNNYLAAIYLRLSKEDGDLSTVGFCDDGFTGTNFDRPDFQKMMEKIKQREINCIIVKDLSRFGRDYIESGRYLEKIFPHLGVRFIAINDNYDSAQKEQAGNEIILPFKNLINDSYARDISIKVRSNLDIKRRNGEFVGTHVIYGYQRSEEDKHRLEIDKTAAAVVQRIFQMKVDGRSPGQIAKQLNEEGVPSPLEYKRLCGAKLKTSFKQQAKSEWSHVAVYRILQDEMQDFIPAFHDFVQN